MENKDRRKTPVFASGYAEAGKGRRERHRGTKAEV